jgi:predicted nucleotide-binding protein
MLKIPQAEAESKLRERISAGHDLESVEPRSVPEFKGLRRNVSQWRDYNQTWLDTNLGGEAANEYQWASTHPHVGGSLSPDRELGFLRTEIASETSKLESILGRLDLWNPRQEARTATGRAGQATPGAPIFIVHGSDTLRAGDVARTVTRATGRETTILREQASLGRTLIEKFEDHAAEASYAIVVLTADDEGGRAGETVRNRRGRQNVIFEMGYFFGILGRSHVCVLLHPQVEKPSDVDGIVYINFDDNGAWKAELFRELSQAGFNITW